MACHYGADDYFPLPRIASSFLSDTRRQRVAMTLWIDADAAPQPVKEVCFRASERLALATVLVANMRLPIPLGYPHVSAVRVDGGPDVADGYIADHAISGDVAVTADIPLAPLLRSKGVVRLHPPGHPYTA